MPVIALFIGASLARVGGVAARSANLLDAILSFGEPGVTAMLNKILVTYASLASLTAGLAESGAQVDVCSMPDVKILPPTGRWISNYTLVRDEI